MNKTWLDQHNWTGYGGIYKNGQDDGKVTTRSWFSMMVRTPLRVPFDFLFKTLPGLCLVAGVLALLLSARVYSCNQWKCGMNPMMTNNGVFSVGKPKKRNIE